MLDAGAGRSNHLRMSPDVQREKLARTHADRRWAVAERRRIEHQVAEMRAHLQQSAVDAEVTQTRRLLLHEMRRRAGSHGLGFLDPDFLALADRPAIAEAVVDAAVTSGGADFCDLQSYHPETAGLRIEAQRGFGDDFLRFFATVGPGQATPCAEAAARREAVLIDDVLRSPIFHGQATLEPVTEAGSRAIYSYPLLDVHGTLHGVLSLHYRKPSPRQGMQQLVAAGAARALTASW